MTRSAINDLVKAATACFETHGWTLPPNPRWDVTDFGLGDWQEHGLVLINLADEPEYCEKLMYARKGMTTPIHSHYKKKEDIICRWGTLQLRLWQDVADPQTEFTARVDGQAIKISAGRPLILEAGSRITLVPSVYHEFVPLSGECIIGEVSTANDDVNDNRFLNPNIGRYPGIEEDESPLVKLIGET